MCTCNQEEAARAHDRELILIRGEEAITNFDVSEYPREVDRFRSGCVTRNSELSPSLPHLRDTVNLTSSPLPVASTGAALPELQVEDVQGYGHETG